MKLEIQTQAGEVLATEYDIGNAEETRMVYEEITGQKLKIVEVEA